MELKRITHIIWDWNGTLLDDAWLCVEVMNGILKEHSLEPITLEVYRDVFGFPVKDYYSLLGFDFKKESFEVVGMEFMIRYNKRQHECRLHPEVRHILSYCRDKGFRQCILSAREQNELVSETVNLEVRPFFELIYGLDDHYAHGKTDVGRRLLFDLNQPAETLIFAGDTLHDAEVAEELGIRCILIPNGHNSESRLKATGLPVMSTLGGFVRNL
jgi:phosphoglycolate phosphatase